MDLPVDVLVIVLSNLTMAEKFRCRAVDRKFKEAAEVALKRERVICMTKPGFDWPYHEYQIPPGVTVGHDFNDFNFWNMVWTRCPHLEVVYFYSIHTTRYTVHKILSRMFRMLPIKTLIVPHLDARNRWSYASSRLQELELNRLNGKAASSLFKKSAMKKLTCYHIDSIDWSIVPKGLTHLKALQEETNFTVVDLNELAESPAADSLLVIPTLTIEETEDFEDLPVNTFRNLIELEVFIDVFYDHEEFSEDFMDPLYEHITSFLNRSPHLENFTLTFPEEDTEMPNMTTLKPRHINLLQPFFRRLKQLSLSAEYDCHILTTIATDNLERFTWGFDGKGKLSDAIIFLKRALAQRLRYFWIYTHYTAKVASEHIEMDAKSLEDLSDLITEFGLEVTTSKGAPSGKVDILTLQEFQEKKPFFALDLTVRRPIQ